MFSRNGSLRTKEPKALKCEERQQDVAVSEATTELLVVLGCFVSAGRMGEGGLWHLFPPLDTAPTLPVHQYL